MNNKIFTFWEGSMPPYIRLCINTWKFDYVILNYDNLNNYTSLPVNDALKRFTLPQIADCVRVHVLRDQGGYWLDADTIIISGKLPEESIMGDDITRSNTIGMLHTEPHSDMFVEWAKYQDKVISDPRSDLHLWSIMGNSFTDGYLKNHRKIKIHPVAKSWPETYMIGGNIPRDLKYKMFYFEEHHHLSDLLPTDMLMLHNSWTPEWYKKLSEDEVMKNNCTLSNILREILIK